MNVNTIEPEKTVVTTAEQVKLILSEKDRLRFWGNVSKNGPVQPHCPELGNCWTWKNPRPDGYGRLRILGNNILAHRVSFQLYFRILNDGECALHRCDFRQCTNPLHLFSGTQTDNIHDMVEKGRLVRPPSEAMPRGEDHWKVKFPEKNMLRGENVKNSKLKEQDVREIRKMLLSGMTNQKISEIFNVNASAISYIKTGFTWKHVP